MRLIVLCRSWKYKFLSFIFLIIVTLHASPAKEKSNVTANPGAALGLTGNIIKYSFCEQDTFGSNGGTFPTIRISLKLRLAFTNVGSYPRLLHRENSRTIGGLRIAHSNEQLEARQYMSTR